MSSLPVDKRKAYHEAWLESLALLLSRMTSAEWRAAEGDSAGDEFAYCLRVSLKGGLAGGQWIGFTAAALAELLQLFLGEPVSLGGELDEMQRESAEELVRQWCGLAASALKPEFGEVQFEVATETSHPQPEEAARLLTVTDGARSIVARLTLGEELAHALAEPPAQAVAAPPPTPPPAAPRPAPSAASSDTAARIEELVRQGNLELLMDVELAVMLRFGCRQATLREVLDLATGAVLELDREIQEPVDLVLNGRIIARGDVVVVDGNYGLRVTEVASPQQRVNSL